VDAGYGYHQQYPWTWAIEYMGYKEFISELEDPMTIVSEPDRKKQNSSVGNITQGDIPAALEAAGINDPLIAQKVLESLAAINNKGNVSSVEDPDAPFGIVPFITENAMVVLEKRYLRKDSNGDIMETPAGMFLRVAKAIADVEKQFNPKADVEKWVEAFYKPMAKLEFVPNSPTLMNAGTGAGTLSACFVMGLEDSMEGIMETAKEAALVQKFGGGTGFALSNIRPKGAPIATTHGKACGPVAVLRHLSSVSTLVTQGGKRDGANMAVMDVHHPDILDFITCKKDEGQIHNFNISVGASQEFMEAVQNGSDYPLRDPITGEQLGTLNAGELFSHIIEGAWQNGEPGMIFLDRVNEDNPTLHIGRMTATNPCGEQPLLPYESCNLGSINLDRFVVNIGTTKGIDWDGLANVVHVATRFLDNVIDANSYSVPEIEKMTKTTRKIGLGVMGFADMLVNLGLPYNGEEGLALGYKVMKFIRNESDKTSEELALERGSFPGYIGSVYDQQGRPMRNACRLTVAPTGTISMIAGCSSGIEPLFSLCYHKHNILEGESLVYVDSNFEEVAKNEFFYSEKLMDFLADGGSIQDRPDVPQHAKDVFLTAADISPEAHVRMQSAFQESVDSGISKTINFPNSATREDVRTAYILAWELGCKGITVYRSGSRDLEVLTSGSSVKNNSRSEFGTSVSATPTDRPAQVHGLTDRVRTGHGNMYITINFQEDRPFEVFSNLGKAGGCDSAQLEAISRLISLGLRSGIDPAQIVEQLRGITCCPAWEDGNLVRSAPDAVALVLGRRTLDGANGNYTGDQFALQEGMMLKSSANGTNESGNTKSRCPECEGLLVYQEGCEHCVECGYEKCG